MIKRFSLCLFVTAGSTCYSLYAGSFSTISKLGNSSYSKSLDHVHTLIITSSSQDMAVFFHHLFLSSQILSIHFFRYIALLLLSHYDIGPNQPSKGWERTCVVQRRSSFSCSSFYFFGISSPPANITVSFLLVRVLPCPWTIPFFIFSKSSSFSSSSPSLFSCP